MGSGLTGVITELKYFLIDRTVTPQFKQKGKCKFRRKLLELNEIWVGCLLSKKCSSWQRSSIVEATAAAILMNTPLANLGFYSDLCRGDILIHEAKISWEYLESMALLVRECRTKLH